MGLTQAGEWADWLNQVSDEREAIAVSFLEQAGAPTVAPGDQVEDSLALGSWLYRWFPVVAEPFMPRGYRGEPGWRSGYFQDEPEYRFGRSWTPPTSSHHGYTEAADALLHSVARPAPARSQGRSSTRLISMADRTPVSRSSRVRLTHGHDVVPPHQT
jgi:hypothetical protein